MACAAVPLYMKLGLIRNWGLGVQEGADALAASDVRWIALLLAGFGLLVLGPALALLPGGPRLALLVYVCACPLAFFSPLAALLTHGPWHRGLVNGLAWLSLPALHWALAAALLLLWGRRAGGAQAARSAAEVPWWRDHLPRR